MDYSLLKCPRHNRWAFYLYCIQLHTNKSGLFQEVSGAGTPSAQVVICLTIPNTITSSYSALLAKALSLKQKWLISTQDEANTVSWPHACQLLRILFAVSASETNYWHFFHWRKPHIMKLNACLRNLYARRFSKVWQMFSKWRMFPAAYFKSVRWGVPSSSFRWSSWRQEDSVLHAASFFFPRNIPPTTLSQSCAPRSLVYRLLPRLPDVQPRSSLTSFVSLSGDDSWNSCCYCFLLN